MQYPLYILGRTFIFFAFLLSAQASLADTYLGRVVGISDGDTITVLDVANMQHKIRLIGIDAPEKKQAFGSVSRQSLADLIFGKTVTIETSKVDRYKRELGKVWIGSADANLEQVRAGLAWHYKQYEREQPFGDRRAYALAEREAQTARRGLWREPAPIPPWEFRKTVRVNRSAQGI